jgi:hypothetical protein
MRAWQVCLAGLSGRSPAAQKLAQSIKEPFQAGLARPGLALQLLNILEAQLLATSEIPAAEDFWNEASCCKRKRTCIGPAAAQDFWKPRPLSSAYRSMKRMKRSHSKELHNTHVGTRTRARWLFGRVHRRCRKHGR